MNKKNNTEKNYWAEIQEQFNKLVEESGVQLDENYQEDIANALGISTEDLSDLERETFKVLTQKNIKVQKVHPDAVLPKYAYPTDSGFDLISVEDIIVSPLGRALVPTGLKLEFDKGFEIQIRPKSGLAMNEGLTILNTPGTIDSGYNGEIKVIVFNTNNNEYKIKKGMKIAQGVLCPVINGEFVEFVEMSELNEKDRGDNGFGSTGI